MEILKEGVYENLETPTNTKEDEKVTPTVIETTEYPLSKEDKERLSTGVKKIPNLYIDDSYIIYNKLWGSLIILRPLVALFDKIRFLSNDIGFILMQTSDTKLWYKVIDYATDEELFSDGWPSCIREFNNMLDLIRIELYCKGYKIEEKKSKNLNTIEYIVRAVSLSLR